MQELTERIKNFKVRTVDELRNTVKAKSDTFMGNITNAINMVEDLVPDEIKKAVDDIIPDEVEDMVGDFVNKIDDLTPDDNEANPESGIAGLGANLLAKSLKDIVPEGIAEDLINPEKLTDIANGLASGNVDELKGSITGIGANLLSDALKEVVPEGVAGDLLNPDKLGDLAKGLAEGNLD